MRDEIADLQQEYDALLLVRNPTPEQMADIQTIENIIARQFGYDWMRNYLGLEPIREELNG